MVLLLLLLLNFSLGVACCLRENAYVLIIKWSFSIAKTYTQRKESYIKAAPHRALTLHTDSHSFSHTYTWINIYSNTRHAYALTHTHTEQHIEIRSAASKYKPYRWFKEFIRREQSNSGYHRGSVCTAITSVRKEKQKQIVYRQYKQAKWFSVYEYTL